jgi:hypothetical protein
MTELIERAREDAGGQLPPPLAVLEMLHGLSIARAVQLAAELGIADHLVDGPRSVGELAAATGTHEPSLYRLMRALASVGVFTETEPMRFAQTARSACLSTDHPHSMRNAARMSGSAWNWLSWAAFAHSLYTGESSFQKAHGTDLWTYLAEVDPSAGKLFAAAMNDTSGQVDQAIAGAYDFARFGTLVDVGGGQGGLLAKILAANPSVRGVLFDQPSVVAGAANAPWGPAMAERWEVVGGDFFQPLPAGGDAYLFKDVFHNWSDDKAELILRNARTALPPNGTLLIVERIFRPGPVPTHLACLDLQMLQIHGSRERTEEEYRGLLARAGFTLTRVVPTPSLVSIVEARPDAAAEIAETTGAEKAAAAGTEQGESST